MAVQPRQIGGLGLLALVPLVIYWGATGRLTPVMITFGVINVLLIVTTLVLGFGPTEGGGEHSSSTSH